MSKPTNRVTLVAAINSLMLILAFARPAIAEQRVLWEIGKFDQSSHEFNNQVDFANPNYSPTFKVGESVNKDWPAFQPGSEVKALGARPHPYTILFSLPGSAKGSYRLRIAVILTRSRVPYLQVELNGHCGSFFFNRRASNYPGDGGADSPVYGGDTIDIDLPTNDMHSGENKLVLTAMDDPADGDGESALNYDALRLTEDPYAQPPAAPRVVVEPTVFYTGPESQLRELTDLTVTLNSKVTKGTVTLAVGQQSFSAELSHADDFGQQRFEFAVPQLTEKTLGRVTVHVNGKTYRSDVQLAPQRKWTLYVVPHAHLDIGYTDYQAKVAEVHSRNVDKLLDEIEENPEMRFSLDGSWIVSQYLMSRNTQTQERLLRLVRERKIAVPAQLANLMTGYPTLEELFRSTSYSQWLHRTEGFPFEYANLTDVPSYTWSYASVLSSLGVKYFLAAANSDRGPILLYGRWNEKSPFWWQGPDGNKVLMSYSRQYSQLSFVCGVPAQEPACRQSLPVFLEPYESPSYKPNVVLMYGSQVENTDLIPGEPQFVGAWNARYAYPRMVLATFPEYMHYIEQHFGPTLDTVAGDGGPYWEDGYATDVHYLTIDRSSQQRAPSAEKLSTITTFFQRDVSGPIEQVRQMWNDLILYAEHTFTSWGGYSRPDSEETLRQLDTKDQFAIEGRGLVNAILDQSFSQLADKIHVPAPALIVFNSLNWTRSDLVETDLDRDEVILDYPDKNPVPFEALAHHPDYDHIRFFARDVPAFGYRCYQIVSRREHAAAGETTLPLSSTIENGYYRIEVDPQAGAIKSVYDKQLNRELVDTTSPYRFNQYLYVSGGDGGTQIVYLRKSMPLANLTTSTSSGGRVTSLRKTAYGGILTYETSGSHASSIQTDVMLFDGENRIEVVNRVHKEPSNNKEAIYFAFPVAVEHPCFTYEIQNGWVDPAHDLLKGANVAWFTVQHWVKVASADLSVGLVPIDSPLVTLGDINRGTWPEKFEPKSGTLFSYVLNNYWHTNFRKVQSGDFTFRYVVTSGQDLAPGALARLGWSAMTPLEIRHLVSNDKVGDPAEPLTPNPTSFLQVDAPDVVVVNWKAAEDGMGTIVRLLESGGQSAKAKLNFPLFTISQAWQTNAAEENESPLKVENHSLTVTLKPHEIVTLRLVGEKMNR